MPKFKFTIETDLPSKEDAQKLKKAIIHLAKPQNKALLRDFVNATQASDFLGKILKM